MKYKKLLIILSIITVITSCNNTKIENKDDYFAFKNEVEEVQKSFENKNISESKYSSNMERFGDTYAENTENIPPEVRYKMSIFCYKEALKYNKKDKNLKEKLANQSSIFKVANQ